MKHYFLSLFPLQLLLCFSSITFADEIKAVASENIHETRLQYGQIIIEAVKSRDFDKCKSALDSLIETFRDEDPNKYVGFMSMTCDSIFAKEGLQRRFG